MTGVPPLAATTAADSPLPPTFGVPPPTFGAPPPALSVPQPAPGLPPPIVGVPPPTALARSVSAEPLLSARIARSWK